MRLIEACPGVRVCVCGASPPLHCTHPINTFLNTAPPLSGLRPEWGALWVNNPQIDNLCKEGREMRQDTAASLAPMFSSSAVVARAADTPLRPVAPGTPYRLAGSALARLVEPSPGVPIAVDLVFSGGASASTCAPVSRPLPAALSHPGCFEYTYVLDGRGSVRLEREKERERAPTTPLACACPTSILVAPSCSLQPLSLSLCRSNSSARPHAARASASAPATPPSLRPVASSRPPPARRSSAEKTAGARRSPGRWPRSR